MLFLKHRKKLLSKVSVNSVINKFPLHNRIDVVLSVSWHVKYTLKIIHILSRVGGTHTRIMDSKSFFSPAL